MCRTYSDSDSLSGAGNAGNLKMSSLLSTGLFFFGEICLPNNAPIAVFLPNNNAISLFNFSDCELYFDLLSCLLA